MAGMIKASDIEYVKAQTNIADVVSDHVALKNAGIDSMKGLCPFHDERSPSFHVRPNLGYFHCFGCGESGDSIKFLQLIDHLTFVEAVERLAVKIGHELSYEDGPKPKQSGPSKTRLLEANLAAKKFFIAHLNGQTGTSARKFLIKRGFDEKAIAHFGIGFAPKSWDSLRGHLRQQGFSEDELLKAGLLAQGNRSAYDRFRGRIMWPIHDTSGSVIGFGARKMFDEDDGPKYLNTPETSVYLKSRVLYGIELAKKAIVQKKRVVVVEGYTDVMACHLAGIEEAVATCGTAFGTEHIALLRRMMGDDPSAQVIFTFDPDEAGKNAALKAFANEHLFSAQTYVAIAPDGLDPADLRLKRGEEALRELFETTQPLFSFALQQSIDKYDLNSVEGRSLALREAAPIVAGIKDQNVKRGYARELANMLAMDESEVFNELANSVTARRSQPQNLSSPRRELSSRGGPGFRLEYAALRAMIQLPAEIGRTLLEQAVTANINDPDLRVIRDAMADKISFAFSKSWISEVLASLPTGYEGLLHELTVSPIPERRQDKLKNYAVGIVVSLLERDLLGLKNELIARLQRIPDSGSTEFKQTQEQILMLEQARRSLQAESPN